MKNAYTYVYIYLYIHICIYIYIYVYTKLNSFFFFFLHGGFLTSDQTSTRVPGRSSVSTAAGRAQALALAETALGGGRFPTTSLSEDVKRLKQLGPEQPGERERAGAGGWRLRGGGGGKADGAIADGYKPSWRDEERRAMHRARMALVVRIREKRALQALGAWARHPCRSEEELLPPLRMSCAGTTKKGKKSGGGLDGLVCGAC